MPYSSLTTPQSVRIFLKPHDFCGVFNQLANHANPQGQPKEKQAGQNLNEPEIHIVPNKHFFSLIQWFYYEPPTLRQPYNPEPRSGINVGLDTPQNYMI
jgi:hypothetical protein